VLISALETILGLQNDRVQSDNLVQ